MSSEAWSGISLASVANNGNVTQLYPTICTAGVAKAGSTIGQLIRRPLQGAMHSLQIRPDGAHGGYLEIWDINGEDGGADVSSAAVITNAQLLAAVNAGRGKLIYRQDFVGTQGSGPVTAAGIYRTFLNGLAARFVSDAGTGVGACEVNIVATGGFCKVESRGSY